MIQQLKHWLVKHGPDSPLVRNSLKMQGRVHGISVAFDSTTILMRKDCRCIKFRKEHFIYVPLYLGVFDQIFDSFVPADEAGLRTLDFRAPSIVTYRETGVKMWTSSLPEEDSSEVYTRHHKPRIGETIWDVGANCGFTCYQFSNAVGREGRVISWEPDSLNQQYLLRNIEMHSLTNVLVERSALAEKTEHPFSLLTEALERDYQNIWFIHLKKLSTPYRP